jgi:hypothetical protein
MVLQVIEYQIGCLPSVFEVRIVGPLQLGLVIATR